MKLKLRKPFDKINNPYVYAIVLDLMDVATGWIPVIGEAMDVLQTGLAFAIFENPTVALFAGGADFLLPVQFDFIPTFTLRVFLAEKGNI